MTHSPKARPYRRRTGSLIAFLHLSLLVLAIVYYFLRGFDLEELTALFAILAPVAALYGGIAFRSLGKNGSEESLVLPPSQIRIIRWLIWGHFIAIGLLISLKALAPNLLNFKEMTIMLGLVESYFGAHMGTLIHQVFGKT